MEEFLSGDDDLAVCAGMDDDWNTSFLEQLDDQEDEEDDDGEDETSAPSPPPPSPKPSMCWRMFHISWSMEVIPKKQ